MHNYANPLHADTGSFPNESLIKYYIDIYGIGRAPEFYTSTGFTVLMPTNSEVEKQFTNAIKILGYKLTSRYLWDNCNITDNPRHIHKKRRFVGSLNFLADHVLAVSFEPLDEFAEPF